jgi:biopolymer transport protein TolR
MVTAPMMVQGVNVSLPQTTPAPLKEEEEHLAVTIDKAGQIYINNIKIPLEIFRDKLKAIVANRADQYLFLRADKDVPYGLVVRVMSEIKEAGIEKLGVVTEPLEQVKKGR